jgi:DNA-3-methyladenine glycosylase
VKFQPLDRAFYSRPVLQVARACVGQYLVHVTPTGIRAGRIVETEAYRGEEDLACHARVGRTPRTAVMYGPPGHAYLFLLYGMHWAFNVVVAAEGLPHAILVRALEPTHGLEAMAAARGLTPSDRRLTNGPGKLCQALGLHRAHNAADLCGPALFLSAGPPLKVGRSPRINVDYAGAWAAKPWRFYARGNPFVSVPPRG